VLEEQLAGPLERGVADGLRARPATGRVVAPPTLDGSLLRPHTHFILADWIEQLRQAVDRHDLEAVVACFAEGYRNETPAHPGRGFVGREQVRENWARIFAGLPDITATVTATAVDGHDLWSEWELAGHSPDGVLRRQRGVIVFRVEDGQATAGRFYLEPVDAGDDGVAAAVGRFAG
jgi:ketosteroid isomerase-like protein